MSSYAHLLNSYLTTPLKPSSFQSNNDTSSVNPNFYKTDNQLQYTGLNQSLLPQGSSLTQQTINPEQYETNYVPKRQSVRTLSQTLDNHEKHAYMNDPPVRQRNKSSTMKENQLGASTRDINTSNKSPDLEMIRKRHEQNIAQAFEDLLKFKPSESLAKQAQPKPKENNYSNILKDIDACVNDMKKYAARPIAPLVHKTDPDYDSFEFQDRKRSVPLSDISNLGQELPHSGGPPHRPSEVESSIQMPSLQKPLFNEGMYSIDNFLPTRSGAVTGNTQRAPIHNLGSSHRADHIHHFPTNRINSAAKLPTQNIENMMHNQQRENYHKQAQSQPINQREHDFVNAIKENLNKESNMSFSNELVDLLARTLLKVMQSTTNTTTTASTHRNQNIIDEGINISSIKTSPRPQQQPPTESHSHSHSQKNQSKIKQQLNLEKIEPVTFLPSSPIKRDFQTQTENLQEDNNATPFIQGPHQNYHSAQFGGGQAREEYERPPTAGRVAKHSYTLSFSGDEHIDKNLLFSNTLQHPPQYPTRHDQSEEKSHHRNSSVQIHESPYGENISPNIFDQSGKHRLSSNLHGLPRPNFTKTAGFAESLRRERSTSASKLRQTLGQQDRTLNLNTKTSDSFNTRPSHLGDQKPFTFLSGSKSRINTRETDFNTVSDLSKGVFAHDVKSNVENAFMEKVQSMQQSFTAFLKQKIEEIHDNNNTQNTQHTNSRIYSNTHRSSATPQKLHATATFSSRPLSFSGTNFPSFDNKVTLLKTSSAAKPSRTSRIESTPPLKSSRKEERSADFPRKTTEKDLQKSLAKQQGPKWKDIQFQEEQEIDRIILSYL